MFCRVADFKDNVIMAASNLLVILCMIHSQVDSAKILMYQFPVKGHILEQACLAEELTSRGNEVYFIVHEDLLFPAMLEKLQGGQIIAFPRESYAGFAKPEEMMDKIAGQGLEGKGDISQISKWFAKAFEDWCRVLLLESEEAFSLLEKIKADVLITSYAVMWKCPYLMTLRLGIPTIPLGGFVEPWLARIPYLPSHVPTYFSPVTDSMGLVQRAQNVVAAFVMGFSSPMHMDVADIIETYRVYGDITDLDSLVTNQTLLWLYSTHVVLDYPKPTMPNVVAVGGMTAEPGKPLSGDILDIVHNIKSRNGIILVSFGSVTSHFPPLLTRRFLSVFASFQDYTFIWRFHNINNLSFPANVIPRGWLPQNDLLANDAVKLVITHCGQRSLFEAVYHAKPLLGVPLFYDQEYNAKFLETKGYGERIDIHTFTDDELIQKMALVLEDGSYKARIETASEIFRGDPETPRQKAARMIEQVIKHGAGHLHSSASDLSWYQYWILDVAGLVCIVSCVVLYASYRIVIRLR